MQRLKARLLRFFLNVGTSGPLTGLLGTGTVLVWFPRARFGPSYTTFFSWAPPDVWGILAIASATLGYYGLFKNVRAYWLMAHGFATFLFSAIAVLFGVNFSMSDQGNPVMSAIAMGLALNAWVRFADLYREPFHRSK